MSYYSGGSGYVLSRGAFTRLMREGLLLPGPRRCAMPHTRAEGISNYPPEWYSINEDVQVIIYYNIYPPIYLTISTARLASAPPCLASGCCPVS